MNKIEALNDIVTGLGGTGGYKYEIQALNAWAVLVGAAGGYKYEIQALNAIDKAKGGTGLHKYNIDALNSICKAAGGSGVNKYEIAALVFIGSNVNSFEPELKTYISGLTTPLSSAQKTKLNTLILALKTGLNINMLSDVFDVLHVYAGETAESSVRNLVKNANHAEAVNSPTFTQYEGFTGNGTSSYIEENWNGRTSGHAVAYSLNSASFGIYVRSFDRSKNSFVLGAYSTSADGGINNMIRFGSETDSTIFSTVNSTLGVFGSNSDNKGFYIISRLADTTFSRYINKVKNDITQSSTNIPNQGIVSLARRSIDGSVGLFSTSQTSFIFLGRGLSEAEVGVINDAVEAYMDSNGKGVIE